MSLESQLNESLHRIHFVLTVSSHHITPWIQTKNTTIKKIKILENMQRARGSGQVSQGLKSCVSSRIIESSTDSSAITEATKLCTLPRSTRRGPAWCPLDKGTARASQLRGGGEAAITARRPGRQHTTRHDTI